jgi:hypothetical protein
MYWRETAPAASVTLVWPLQAARTSLLREHERAPFFFRKRQHPIATPPPTTGERRSESSAPTPAPSQAFAGRRNTGRGIGKPDPVHRISIHKSG